MHAKGNLQALPIHFASAFGDPYVIKKLIDNGADIHAPFGAPGKTMWMSCLDLACMRGNLAAAKVLIDHGADPNDYHSQFSPLKKRILPRCLKSTVWDRRSSFVFQLVPGTDLRIVS